MNIKNKLLLFLLGATLIYSQTETILPAQEDAIKSLSQIQGFSDENLNSFLYKEYGVNLSGLSKKQAIAIIQKFQGANPPKPSKVEPLLADILEVGMSKRFYLKNGNIIKGNIIELDNYRCHIETAEGLQKIPMNEILEESVDLIKNDGVKYKGTLLEETAEKLVIRTNYSDDLTVYKQDIKKIDRFHGGKLIPLVEYKKIFSQGSEELISVHMDEKAFVLDPNTFYLSAMSIGYGFTDRFMIKTKFGPNFNGDLNLQPKMRFWHKKTASQEQAMAWGLILHRAYPEKKIISDYSHAWSYDGGSLNNINWTTSNLDNYNLDSRFLFEGYFVYSTQRTNPSGRGKVGWSIGLKTSNKIYLANKIEEKLKENYNTTYIEFNKDDEAIYYLPFRAWANFDYDLQKKLKFVGSMWLDNTHRSANLESVIEDYFGDIGEAFSFDDLGGEHTLVDFDFGFLYAVNDNLRLGLHFQKPYLDIYWKFLEF